MIQHITLAIPTREINSNIKMLIALYRPHFAHMRIIFDDRYGTPPRDIDGIPVIPYRPDDRHIAADLVDATRDVPTEWVLRIDADEVIGETLLNALEQSASELGIDGDAYGIARYWCLYDNRQLFALPQFARIGYDFQGRLYRPSKMKRHEEFHSAGFDSELKFLQPDLCLLHFDWMLTSYVERKRKLLGYDARRPGYLRDHFHYYLWEKNPDILFAMRPIQDRFALAATAHYLQSKTAAFARYPAHQIAHLMQEAMFYETEFEKIKEPTLKPLST